MNENTTKLLEQLAQKLGTTSEYLWTILVSQAHLDAWHKLIMLMLSVLAFILITRLNLRAYSKGEYLDQYDDLTPRCGWAIVSTIVTLAFLIYGLSVISDILSGFFNPQFWALNYVMEALK